MPDRCRDGTPPSAAGPAATAAGSPWLSRGAVPLPEVLPHRSRAKRPEWIVTRGTRPPDMRHDRGWNVPNRHPSRRGAPAEIRILEVHEEALIEAAELPERLPPDRETGAGDEVRVECFVGHLGACILSKESRSANQGAQQRQPDKPPSNDVEAQGADGNVAGDRQKAGGVLDDAAGADEPGPDHGASVERRRSASRRSAASFVSSASLLRNSNTSVETPLAPVLAPAPKPAFTGLSTTTTRGSPIERSRCAVSSPDWLSTTTTASAAASRALRVAAVVRSGVR